jgi:tetratricopeptide (TPR) repeat protein
MLRYQDSTELKTFDGRGERMKRIAITAVVLAVCVSVFGQDKTKQQGAAAAGQTPTPPAGQAATPPGKRPPQAKTQPEFEAYKAAIALTDAAAQEKAADDFAAKFPDSELRVVLYKAAMQKYGNTGNPDKMLDVGQKALTFDPDDPEALVGVAQVLTERTKDTALDKDQRLAEAKKDAERALATVDTDVPTSGYPPEKIDQFKRFVKSEAYAILGTLAANAENYPEAEIQLKKSIEALPESVDPVAVLRLAIALDKQNKTADALKYANQAVDLTKDQPDGPAGKAARAEQDRLKALNSGTAPGQSTPAKN